MPDTLRACGVLIVRGTPPREFLLMRHADRWDIPKGHVDLGESDRECAFRELEEETGISQDDIVLDPKFRWEHQYRVRTPRVPSGEALKTLVVFLGELTRDVTIRLTEHPSYAWFPWAPPHRIQTLTIDPLLSAVAAHFRAGGTAQA
ncbi:MAG: NUDIX domain-containing protein [Planctomyces sp.]|nr:NUDIX domain-containing protein [Planctomyces sp.]